MDDGEKIGNERFKKQQDKKLRRLNRKLSRRWGSANMAYRDYNKAIRAENKLLPEAEKKALAKPSTRYQKTKQSKALLERKIARQRDTYYHQKTAEIVGKASLIAVETLRVKNMMRNHKLAYSLGDAAMSDFITKLKYKAQRSGVEIRTIGTFEPSSQICSTPGCGYLNTKVKSLGVREWTCPQCGVHHDRDVNAAKNILRIALEKGGTQDVEIKEAATRKKPPGRRKPRDTAIFPDSPQLVIRFSRELTRTNDPRYIIINKTDGTVVDDAQGAGYRSIANAKNCFKAKAKWSQKQCV